LLRQLDFHGQELKLVDAALARVALASAHVKRLMTIPGVDATVALSIVAAVGDFRRFSTPQKLVSYLGLNPRVRQSGGQPASHGRITKQGRAHARGMLVEAAWVATKIPGPLRASAIIGAAAWVEGSPLVVGLGASGPDALGNVQLTATVTETGLPVTDATVRVDVRGSHGSQRNLALVDDGLHGDGASDDGVYGQSMVGLSPDAYTVLVDVSRGVFTSMRIPTVRTLEQRSASFRRHERPSLRGFGPPRYQSG
jgi:hypothetical protein